MPKRDDADTIPVVTYESEDLSRGPGDLITATLDVDKLRANLRAFVNQLHVMVDWERDIKSPFQLQEIEFGVEITAEGEFKLIGVGTSAGVKGAVKFVLKRESEKVKAPVVATDSTVAP